MSRKAAVETRVVEFFETANFDVAETVLNIVRGVMKRREGEASPGIVPVAKKPRKKRGPNKPKVQVPSESQA